MFIDETSTTPSPLHFVLFFTLLLATMAALEHFMKGNSSKSTRGLLRIIILLTIAAAAVSARLFSVIREYAP